MDVQPQKQRKIAWRRWLIVLVVFILIVAGAVLWVLENQGPWINLVPIILFTVLGVIIALFQWLFPVTNDQPERTALVQIPPAHVEVATPTAPLPPIIVQVPSFISPPSSEPQPVVSAITYRSIIAVPPPTDARTIQQREIAVREVYVRLTQPDTSAIVLTGIGGVGKSTLAALVYRYAEEQRGMGKGPFTAEALWLKIDSSVVTMTDLVGTVFSALGKPLPDLSSLAPHNQAAILCNALNAVEEPRFIVLDQFENLLDWQSGYVLVERPGIGEWLDALNGQASNCRILLTSRLWPQGTKGYISTYMQEYRVRGLSLEEGIELLQKLNISAPEEELRQAVKLCDGHAYALTLLAVLLHHRNLSLNTFFKDPTYRQLWTGNVARNLLDYIYVQQLGQLQRRLLLAFSVYRQPVPLEAASAIVDPREEIARSKMHLAFDALLAQHLVQSTDEELYQLHTVVMAYAHEHFDENSDLANQDALRVAHGLAAAFYRQYATMHCPPRKSRRKRVDVQPLIEAIWQYCQAERWQEAYDLLRQEGIYSDLLLWGNAVLLHELYLLFPLTEQWLEQQTSQAQFYDELGEVERLLGRALRARTSFERALSLCREAGDLEHEGRVMNHLGRVYADLGQKRKALEYYEKALELHRSVKNRSGEATVLTNMGWAYYDVGLMDLAREKYEEALNIRREIKDLEGEASTLSSLGRIYEKLGQLEDARPTLMHALELSRRAGDRAGEGWILNNLGRVYYGMGLKDQARTYYEDAIRIRQEVGERRGEGATLSNLGMLLVSNGELAEAEECFKEALAIRREVGDRSGEGKTLNSLGMFYIERGEYKQALPYFQDALRIRRELGHTKRQGKTLDNLGRAYFFLRKYEVALACFLLASESFEKLRQTESDISLGSDPTPEYIDELKRTISEPAFVVLREDVEGRVHEIVEAALREAEEKGG